jgi:hypothetical protein
MRPKSTNLALKTAETAGSQGHTSQNHEMRSDAPEEIHKLELSVDQGQNVTHDDKNYPHDHKHEEQQFRNGDFHAKKPQQDKDSRGNGADRKNNGANIGAIPLENSLYGLVDFTALKTKKLGGKTHYSYGKQVKSR